MQYKILVVDDETANLRLLERLFRGTYEVHSAASAAEAIELLEVHDISLIVSDQRMPGMTGIEFLKCAAEMRPQTVRIMLTGYSDAEALVEAINSGAVYKYLTKPWVNDELMQTAKRALQHCESLRAQRQLQVQHERLRNRANELKETVVTLVGELLASERADLKNLAYKRREAAIKIGRLADFAPEQLEPLGMAAFVLDLAGGISTADASENFNALLAGLASAPEFEEAFSILSYAREHFDGTGDPNGYAGDEIPLAARALAVADAAIRFGAVSNGDPSCEIATGLRAISGSRLDPELVEAYCGHEILQIPGEVPPLELFS